MEELKKLEQIQKTMLLMESSGIIEASSSSSCRFLANLVLLLIEPCGELGYEEKCNLISEYLSKISAKFLSETFLRLRQGDSAARWLIHERKLTEGYEQEGGEILSILEIDRKPQDGPFQNKSEKSAVVGMDAIQRANSTLEDFCRSYFMFHGIDANRPQTVFKYLPILSFTESFIYQVDIMNEKIVSSGITLSEGRSKVNQQNLDEILSAVKCDPFGPLKKVLECRGLLTERLIEEFKCGEKYWDLERKLCCPMMTRDKISVEDVIRAIHLKSFDYRVLNLLLYQLRGEEVNEQIMEFLSISEFLVEVADDLFDYEDDVLENSFNVLRLFVKVHGASAPAVLAKYISEAEEKYDRLLKALDPELSLLYRRRCEEATKEGGKTAGHPLGTWTIPPLILDEESFRLSVRSVSS